MLIDEIAGRHADVGRPAASTRTPIPTRFATCSTPSASPPRCRRDSLGAYVITMASRASDVLAVELLQKLAGNRAPAARRAAVRNRRRSAARRRRCSTRCSSLPWYRARIAGHQEVMVGYSDSAKDAGRFAAAWALYRAQEEIVAACARHGVAADAVPRPRRQRRPRRRADAPRDPVAAAGFDRRPPARDRAGRDDPGEVRPARHRRANAWRSTRRRRSRRR